jgi:hypothetical protein
MHRDSSSSRDGSLIKARCVVVAHRGFVVATVIIHQSHLFDGITRLKQCLENRQKVISDGFGAHQLTQDGIALGITMQHLKIA